MYSSTAVGLSHSCHHWCVPARLAPPPPHSISLSLSRPSSVSISQVLNGCGHGMPVDLWALGVLIYELLVGQTPFKSASVDEMYERIAAGDYAFPAAPAPPASEGRSARSTTRSTKGAAKSSSLAGARKDGGGGGGGGRASMQKGVVEGNNYDDAKNGSGRYKSNNDTGRFRREWNEEQQQQQPAQLEKLDQKCNHHHHHSSSSSKSNSTKRTTSTTTNTNSSSSRGRSYTNVKSKSTAAQDPAAQALVKALLCLSPGHRPSIPEIKRHPFFSGVDFAGLRAAVRAQAEEEEEEAVVSAAIDGGDVWVRGQPVVCRSEDADDNYGGVFSGF